MGMNTELLLKVGIKKEVPADALSALKFLFGDRSALPEKLPDHPFFKSERWKLLGSHGSPGHIPQVVNIMNDRATYIFSRSDFKDFGETQLFLDWALPYLEPAVGDCYGWVWYEIDPKPSLILRT